MAQSNNMQGTPLRQRTIENTILVTLSPRIMDRKVDALATRFFQPEPWPNLTTRCPL